MTGVTRPRLMSVLRTDFLTRSHRRIELGALSAVRSAERERSGVRTGFERDFIRRVAIAFPRAVVQRPPSTAH